MLLYLTMQKAGFTAFIGFLLLISISGCVQVSCCGYPAYYYVCTKGSISTTIYITGPAPSVQNMVNDSLNAYQANGYTCNPTGPPYSLHCVRGQLNIKRDIRGGYQCSGPDDNGYCSDGGLCAQ
jgi:hypothetical protein